MSEDDESEDLQGFLSSKFWRTLLMVVAVILIFAGPTYIPYLLNSILHVDYVASVVSGFALLVVGLLLLWYLIRKRIVT
jgi:L-lactate permease